MFKVFASKPLDRVYIYPLREEKLTQKLVQAKGVMNNYLKDKTFSVKISQCSLDDEYVQVVGMADSKKSLSSVSVKKHGDVPFLRKIYTVIEMFANDKDLNNSK